MKAIRVVSICSGIAGHLVAIALLGTGAFLLVSLSGMDTRVSVQVMMTTVAVCAAARTGLGYVEQYFGHDSKRSPRRVDAARGDLPQDAEEQKRFREL